MYRVSFELQKHKWTFGRTRNVVETRATPQHFSSSPKLQLDRNTEYMFFISLLFLSENSTEYMFFIFLSFLLENSATRKRKTTC